MNRTSPHPGEMRRQTSHEAIEKECQHYERLKKKVARFVPNNKTERKQRAYSFDFSHLSNIYDFSFDCEDAFMQGIISNIDKENEN